MKLTTPSTWGIYRATINEAACVDELCGTSQAISMRYGGEQSMLINAGAPCANGAYWMLGSVSGTAGLAFGGLTLPLSGDAYTNFTINNPNQPPLVNSTGFLDGQGKAQGAKIQFPADSSPDPNLVGLTVYHAVAASNSSFTACNATNAVSVVLVP